MPYEYERPGYVYFAKHPSRDVMKIGFSDRPIVRVTQIHWLGEYGKFRLVGVLKGKGRLEQIVHQFFDEWRLPVSEAGSTEFFRYSAIAALVEDLLDGKLPAFNTLAKPKRSYRRAA